MLLRVLYASVQCGQVGRPDEIGTIVNCVLEIIFSLLQKSYSKSGMSSSLGSLSPLTSASSFHSSLLSVVGAPPPLAFFPGFSTFGAGGGGPTNLTEKEAESEQGRRTGADSSRASAEKGGVAVARGSAVAAIGGVGRGWDVVLIVER